ncbi:type VI secretion protein [Polymorphobacter multimanifer]|uniref:VirB4 family type IV secretion/conjugal transfer ATPase n=1 Tax=Polymorphobacter multimanifer TaxID=1070431 RepID=UPI00166305A0|nr:VirB4 family type IV secretion/conjugal transfer ATPase [Polymorphobacter multimanifer]GGI85131.1 type VI secretion protein [Polymorphobacter multimanifer]
MRTARRTAAAKEAAIGDHLPYAAQTDDFTIVTRDGCAMQVIRLAGLPFETIDAVQLEARKTARDAMVQAVASSRFALVHHVVRRAVTASLDGVFGDPFSAALDTAWRSRLALRRLYVNDLYLTLVIRPTAGRAGIAEQLLKLVGAFNLPSGDSSAEVRLLNQARETLMAALDAYRPELLCAYDLPNGLASEPAEFLAMLVNDTTGPVLLPIGDLGHALPRRRLSFGADAIELGAIDGEPAEFAAILSVKDYPAQTSAGMFDDLYRLPFEMTVTQTFAIVDRGPGLERMDLALRRMRSADDAAVSLRGELEQAKDDVAAGRAVFGEHHLTVMLKAATLAELDQNLGEAQALLAEAGFAAVREDLGLEAAFWAQFPGNFSYIARRALVSSANFAGFASAHNFPVGLASGNHWGSAVTLFETTSAGPYFFNFHRGDLGNFTVIGPSGSGKTVVLGFLLAQARRFNPRIVFFDKDRGAEIFLRAIGGVYDNLRPGEPTRMNPLALPDTAANRLFLNQWLARLVTGEGAPPTTEELAWIADAVDASFAGPPAHRRLRYLAELFRGRGRASSSDIAARLAPWHSAGEHAWLFDNEFDALDLGADSIGFDMTAILDIPALRSPAMLYLFHRVEERLDGRPTIIVVDEGWKALDDDVFVARIRDWEKTIRKRGGIMGFATQSASDALQSRIASAIIEQAGTQIFMANASAQASDYIDGFGLTAHELDLVRTIPDNARAFLVKHGNDSVVVRLNLASEPELLMVLSGRERTVRLLDSIRAQVGDDPTAWLPRLLAAA